MIEVVENTTPVDVVEEHFEVSIDSDESITVQPSEEITQVVLTSDATITVQVEEQPPILVEPVESETEIIEVQTGQPGPTGARGLQGFPGPETLFVSPTAPTTSFPTYLWIQTQIGPSNGVTFWIEDGS